MAYYRKRFYKRSYRKYYKKRRSCPTGATRIMGRCLAISEDEKKHLKTRPSVKRGSCSCSSARGTKHDASHLGESGEHQNKKSIVSEIEHFATSKQGHEAMNIASKFL